MIAAAHAKPRFTVPPEAPPKVGYDIVHLADDEWGNAKMLEVADEYFRDHPDCQFVLVYEHAGWSLGFCRDLSVWSSANDMAVLNPSSHPTGDAMHVQRRPGPMQSLKERT